VTITAVASDVGGVARVKFYDGGTWKATVTAPPYTFAWSVTSADNGVHAWIAKAVDESGNSAVSLPVSLTVNIQTVSIDTTAPTGSLVINGGAAATASTGDRQVSLSWAGFADGGSGLAATNRYKLVFNRAGSPVSACTSGTLLYAGSGTSFTHTALTNGSLYYYRVCAVDKTNNT